MTFVFLNVFFRPSLWTERRQASPPLFNYWTVNLTVQYFGHVVDRAVCAKLMLDCYNIYGKLETRSHIILSKENKLETFSCI